MAIIDGFLFLIELNVLDWNKIHPFGVGLDCVSTRPTIIATSLWLMPYTTEIDLKSNIALTLMTLFTVLLWCFSIKATQTDIRFLFLLRDLKEYFRSVP